MNEEERSDFSEEENDGDENYHRNHYHVPADVSAMHETRRRVSTQKKLMLTAIDIVKENYGVDYFDHFTRHIHHARSEEEVRTAADMLVFVSRYHDMAGSH